MNKTIRRVIRRGVAWRERIKQNARIRRLVPTFNQYVTFDTWLELYRQDEDVRRNSRGRVRKEERWKRERVTKRYGSSKRKRT